MRLREVLEGVKIYGELPDVEVKDICIDSRLVKEGVFSFVLKG